MRQDWLSFVADKLADKEQWSGLQWVDWQFTQRIRSKSGMDPAAMGNFTTGAAIFSDQKKHFLDENFFCAHCGKEDSQTHRFYECPHYHDCRHGLPVQLLQSLPQLQVQKGLFRKPHAIAHWEQVVRGIHEPSFHLEFDEHVFLFTDGSTFASESVPSSAWSVVLADPEKMDATIVESGWLRGAQNNFRAELYAVLVAIQHCLVATIFVHNEAVVLGMHRLQQCGWETAFWLGHDHLDLWRRIWDQWEPKQPKLWTIYHVNSHQDISLAKSWWQAWQIYHNDVADSVAVAKNKQRPPDQLQALALARMEFRRVVKQAHSGFTLQQKILLSAKCAKVTTSADASHRVWGPCFQVPSYVVQETEAMMCPPFLSVLAQFMAGQWVQCQPPMSLLELYIIFTQVTGWLVPINIATWSQELLPARWRCKPNVRAAWLHETTYKELSFARQSLNKQLKTFGHAFKRMLLTMGVPASMIKAASLQHSGTSMKFQSVTAVPSICQSFPNHLRELVQKQSLPVLVNAVYNPPIAPQVSDVAQISPTILWNLYFASRR